MKIKEKFILINGFIFLSVIIISGLSIWSVNKNREIESTIKKGVELIAEERKLHGIMKDLMFDIFTPQTYRLLKDLLYAPRFNTTFINFHNESVRFKRDYLEFMLSSQVKRLLRDEELRDEYSTALLMSKKAFKKINAVQKGVRKLVNMGIIGEEGVYQQIQSDKGAALREFFDDLRATSYYLTNNFESFLTHFIRSLERESLVIRRQMLISYLSIILFIGLLVIVLTVGFSNRITGRIRRVEDVLRKASTGDFSTKLDIDTKDEFGLLSNHFNLFVGELKKRTDRVLKLFEDVSSTIGGNIEGDRDLSLEGLLKSVVKSGVEDSTAEISVIFVEPSLRNKYSLNSSMIGYHEGKVILEGDVGNVKFNGDNNERFNVVVNTLRDEDLISSVREKGFIELKVYSPNLVSDSVKGFFPLSLVGFALMVNKEFFGAIFFVCFSSRQVFTDLDFIQFNSFSKYSSLVIENFIAYNALLKKGEAEYMALQSQINPHFLYNILNGLVGLNRMGERRILENAIFSLKNMLRYTLEQKLWTTVRDEFAFIEEYCALQKLRFQERLDVVVRLEEGVESYRIPKLILQPIVENAIIHGIEPLDEGGVLEVEAYRNRTNGKGRLVLVVRDSGVGFKEGVEMREGIGIMNVKERLKMAFKNVEFNIRKRVGNGTEVVIEIGENGLLQL